MRISIVLLFVLLLASCSTTADSPDPVASENASINATDPEPVETIPDTNENATVNASEAVGNVSNATSAQPRLNTSVLGIVPSDDPTPRIVSFALISGVTDRPIQGYENMTGTVRIDRERVPRSLALRANYAGEVGSVLFELNDDEYVRVENTAPFALHGDDFGSYVSWYPNKGRQVIVATPYERADALGEPAQSRSITIEFYAEDYLDRVNNP